MDERAILVLEDGRTFDGYRFGAPVDAEGEIVFNTGMTGYQEICTDPSYRGQMVVLTYPLIGNYGVNGDDSESTRPWLAALVVRERFVDFSNWRASANVHAYLERHGVPGVYGLDTRALTRHLRNKGTMRCILTTYREQTRFEELVERARNVTPLSEKDVVTETSSSCQWELRPTAAANGARIVVVDCGIKHNILRSLQARGAELVVVPFSAKADEILALRPNGVVVSNGPGDPALLSDLVATVRALVNSAIPFLGICLGHQVLGRAIGATTSRLKFGHHGSNHPVKDVLSGRVYITSQNHEFQVDRTSIPSSSGFFVSQINLNDGSVEGLGHHTLPICSVQYHPEGCPGPQDNQYVFDKFVEMVLETMDTRWEAR